MRRGLRKASRYAKGLPMLELVEVDEQNWLDVRNLSVAESQEGFLDSALGIIARGYIYRSSRARVIGIACYDLQQFMIDKRFQGRGLGTLALHMILSELERERKYDCVEVCVKAQDAAALHVYEKVGFADTGYVDEDAPDCLNLMYRFAC